MNVALITGAASGLGLATAQRFLDGGWAVVGVDKNAEAGAEIFAQLGPTAKFVAADVASEADILAACGQG